MSLDTLILRPGDEGYIEPRSDAVQNQPILINSGKDEFVDDPEIPQKDDSKTNRKKVLLKTQVFTYKKTWRLIPEKVLVRRETRRKYQSRQGPGL